MTRTTNAWLAGFTFLFYIATGITGMILFGRATRGAEGTAATLASLAQHAALVRGTVVLTLVEVTCALVLAVTLWALTRDEDRDLAMLALCCRVTEGAIGGVAAVRTVGLLSVATGAASSDAAAVNALGAMLLAMGDGSILVAATCFALGSTLYSYLFLRARSIPVQLAWLGVVASLLLVVALPARLAGALEGPAAWLVWMPMLVFELALALWLLVKGVAEPVPR